MHRPAGQVLATMMVGLGLASFLNSSSLVATAHQLPLDAPIRPVAVSLADALHTASDWLLLNLPRAGIDAALGRTAPPHPTSPTTTTSVTAFPETTATTSVTARVPTAADPLRVWIIGDSLVREPGEILVNLAAKSGVIDAALDFKLVSGLTRDDFFDWPTHIEASIPRLRPEVIVVMFGGNDGQSVVVEGELLEKWTPVWLNWYRPRVDEAMDALDGEGRRIFWIGLPIMRDPTFSEHVTWLNQIYSAEADGHPGVTFVDTFSLFSDSQGRYADYLTDEDGSLHLMRAQDGAHFTAAGGTRLAKRVLSLLQENGLLP